MSVARRGGRFALIAAAGDVFVCGGLDPGVVGHEMERSVLVAKRYRAQSKALYRALRIAALDAVADPEDVFGL